jgi:hypothetical protein
MYNSRPTSSCDSFPFPFFERYFGSLVLLPPVLLRAHVRFLFLYPCLLDLDFGWWMPTRPVKLSDASP